MEKNHKYSAASDQTSEIFRISSTVKDKKMTLFLVYQYVCVSSILSSQHRDVVVFVPVCDAGVIFGSQR